MVFMLFKYARMASTEEAQEATNIRRKIAIDGDLSFSFFLTKAFVESDRG